MNKVFLMTFGCKVNRYETDCLRGDFSERGFEIAESVSGADVVIINSCTVTGSGDSKVLYALRKCRKENPEAVIVLTGCLPQSNPNIAKIAPEADIITGTKDRKAVPELVEGVLRDREKIFAVEKYTGAESFEIQDYSIPPDRTRAFVKIQDGCNSFCSYCIIPYARGRCRSKPIEVIEQEVRKIADSGCKEVVLSGINLAFYGREYGLRLADAVETCCGVSGIERVRLGSIEPEMLLDSDIERFSELEKLCPQFHLSLQSGCGRTLKAMNRKYTPEDYAGLVEKIRRIFPDCAITTDIMVGFPCETDTDFAESLDFVRKIGFAGAHVFQYSPRSGTPASRMEQISDEIKSQRADIMKNLVSELKKNHLEKQVGRTVPVLFERERSAKYHQGHAPDYTVVKILRENEKKSLRNLIFYVTIKESCSDFCIGAVEKGVD